MKTEKKPPARGIDGNTLKVIAVAAMFIDHIGASIVEAGIFGLPGAAWAEPFLSSNAGINWYLIDIVLRMVGRISFPIFCFLLVEGFCHTRNFNRYAVRLGIFALISELPFNYAFCGSWIYPGAQNVFFTLFMGLLVLKGYAYFAEKPVWQGLVIIGGCTLALVFRVDYDITGITLILLLYIFRNNKRYQTIAGAILCALESFGAFGTAALAFIPIRMYNGEKGSGKWKYFFYWFYPAHILLLILVRAVIFH